MLYRFEVVPPIYTFGDGDLHWFNNDLDFKKGSRIPTPIIPSLELLTQIFVVQEDLADQIKL